MLLSDLTSCSNTIRSMRIDKAAIKKLIDSYCLSLFCLSYNVPQVFHFTNNFHLQ